MEKVTVSREHTTLDLLLFRRFGAAGQFLLESVLDANRGLSEPSSRCPSNWAEPRRVNAPSSICSVNRWPGARTGRY